MNRMRKMINKLNCSKDIFLFIRIFLLITLIPVLVRIFTLPKLLQVLTPRNSNSYQNRQLHKYKQKIIKFTDFILNWNTWIWRPTCLKRSLVLYFFLRELGLDIQICFGVRYNQIAHSKGPQKQLAGHAWLQYNGNYFLEKNNQITDTYKLTYTFPNS